MDPPAPAELAELVARLRAAGCVFAEDEAALLVGAARDPLHLEQMSASRLAGLPLEQVLGWAGFCGLRVAVDPGVFVPRRRTEWLVRCARELLQPGLVVLDLCCGSGAIGAALLAAEPAVTLYAADVDPAALACARRNLGPGVQVLSGDLWQALPPGLLGRLDLVVANAPYVPTGSIALMPPEARLHEHRVALDGGGDGLALHRRIAAGAGAWLRRGGHLLLETSDRQAAEGRALLVAAGLTASVRSDPDTGATLVTARRP